MASDLSAFSRNGSPPSSCSVTASERRPRVRFFSTHSANSGSACSPCNSNSRATSLARGREQAACSWRPGRRAGASSAAASEGGPGRRSSCMTISSPGGASSSPGSTSYRMYPYPGSTLVRICGASSEAGACCAPAASAAKAHTADHTTAIPTSAPKVRCATTRRKTPCNPGRPGCAWSVDWRTIRRPRPGHWRRSGGRQHLPHRLQQLFGKAGLLQGGGSAGGDRDALVVGPHARRERENGKGREARILAEPAQHGEAIQLGQGDVEDDHVGRMLFDRLERGDAVLRAGHLETMREQELHVHLARVDEVLDDEDADGHGCLLAPGRGSCIRGAPFRATRWTTTHWE